MTMLAGDTILASDFTGWVATFPSRVMGAAWLPLKASGANNVSRSTYSALFAFICPSSTVTITIATPGVISWTAHPLIVGDTIVLTTTGALPTGFTSGTKYYVVSTTTNSFQLSATRGGTAINTTGSQSGTHTAQFFNFGTGDGSTTFGLPNIAGRVILGEGANVITATIVSATTSVITASGLTNNSNNEFQTGQPVVFTAGTAGNLVNATTYYVIRVSNTTFSLATTLANAQNGNVITLAGTETGSFALSLTNRVMGDTTGEETHAMSSTELLAHVHGAASNNNNSGPYAIGVNAASSSSTVFNTTSVGGNAAMNNMQPGVVLNYWIHI